MTGIFTSLLTSFVLTCSPSEQLPEIQLPVSSTQNITIDAHILETEWQDAKKISTFINPWNKDVEPYTEVNLLWNGKDLFFYFLANDKDVVVADKLLQENDVSMEDRVELFFSSQLPLTDYYAIEMDPLGRVLDYSIAYYRKFNKSWNADKHLQVKGRLTPQGYCVEGCIKEELLQKMTNGKKRFYLGAYRAEFKKDKEGKLLYNWLCIKDPHLEKPDFHVAETFIQLVLE